MGCLKSLLRKIIFIAIVVAFFSLGGYAFVKKLINNYQNPTREEFIASEKNYGDFSDVPSDYQLTRSYNIIKYKKINAKYLPTGQKINIFDLKNEKLIAPEDFKTSAIDEKIADVLDKTKDSFITLEDFKIIQRGEYKSANKTIPYIKYSAKVKNIPFKNVMGIVAAYSTKNQRAKENSTKIIFTMVDKKAFNPAIIQGFVQGIKF